jgi:2-oxoglutarate dehydrogenase E1 component
MKTIEPVATEGANGTDRAPLEFSLLNENAQFVETLYFQYLKAPESVDEEWREYFSHLTNGASASPSTQVVSHEPASTIDIEKQAGVVQLIRAYRELGHFQADLDPLGITPKWSHPELDPSYYGFTQEDMDREFSVARLFDMPAVTLRGILSTLREAYCGTLAVEFMHIEDPAQCEWIQEHMEDKRKRVSFPF